MVELLRHTKLYDIVMIELLMQMHSAVLHNGRVVEAYQAIVMIELLMQTHLAVLHNGRIY